MDSEHQQYLIEQLVPLLREKDFKEIFNRMTQEENSNSHFLIKMELKRECSPYRRGIDMRDALEDECLVHEFDGITHFMPADTIALFQSQCAISTAISIPSASTRHSSCSKNSTTTPAWMISCCPLPAPFGNMTSTPLPLPATTVAVRSGCTSARRY